ncbi:MAG: hypothetical protein H0V01_06140 [Bacteroidetes bacterium]|nr:hypothetical protein [Bacteroidota bacterium]HET6244092.1 hypothetical protein [Bacteroidia bacterium]
MIRKIYIFIPVLSAISFSLVLSSCQTEVPKENVQLETETVQGDLGDQNVTYILPSPLQIASIFKRSGLEYISGLTNPVSNSKNYAGIFSKSLAMGVYSADLAYGIINNQTQDALNNLKTIKDISSDLGLSSIFETETLLTRFESNMGNEDSLAYIISDLQMDMDAYLEENEKEHLAVLIFTGAWIESMYIGSKAVSKANNQKLSNRLGEQFIILDNLIKALKVKQNANESIPKLITALEDIKTNFDSFTKETEETSEAIIMKEEELKLLSSKVQDLRSKIIAGNL